MGRQEGTEAGVGWELDMQHWVAGQDQDASVATHLQRHILVMDIWGPSASRTFVLGCLTFKWLRTGCLQLRRPRKL